MLAQYLPRTSTPLPHFNNLMFNPPNSKHPPPPPRKLPTTFPPPQVSLRSRVRPPVDNGHRISLPPLEPLPPCASVHPKSCGRHDHAQSHPRHIKPLAPRLLPALPPSPVSPFPIPIHPHHWHVDPHIFMTRATSL
jgi:hypothetical protein